MIPCEGGTEDELRAVSNRQCLLLVGTRGKHATRGALSPLQLIPGCHGNQLGTHQRRLSHRREPVGAN